MRARDNPFRVERLHALRFRPQGVSWDELLARLEQLNYRCAIAGPDGSGKTTLLLELEPLLAARGFRPRRVFINRDSPRPLESALEQLGGHTESADIVLFDGGDLLKPRDWRRFAQECAPAGGLIITSHREGLLPTLLWTRTSAELLEELMHELLPDDNVPTHSVVTVLHARSNGNIRDALRKLYDFYASSTRPIDR